MSQPISDILETGEEFRRRYEANARHLHQEGLYDPEDEHDACGVGLVAAIDGQPRRAVVEAAIQALKSVWHRGAVDADGKTGDGAGLHLQIPAAFFHAHVARSGVNEARDTPLGVGMVFLPRTDLDGQERCRTIVETEILGFGYAVHGWRQVPVNIDIIGEKANATRPEIEQIIVANTRNVPDDQFERDLYILRRRIEKRVIADQINGFYICSLSSRSIIYKGMFLAEQVTAFYPDLLDQRFESSFAIYHQRYSTNTFPTWPLAQPFRILAHNGEINTLRGNVNWMKSHETKMDHPVFAEHLDILKPVIQAGGSDSAALDNVFELLIRAGRELPMVKALMVPEAWSERETMPERHRDLYSYCNSVMEPWDGPAALAMTDGIWVLAGLDRNGLRPMRYSVTRDGLLITGSETGMVKLNEADIIEKGRLGPGEMLGVNLAEGKLYHHAALRGLIAESRPFGDWVRNVTPLEALAIEPVAQAPEFDRASLRRQQVALGWNHEDLELILQPMAEEGKEAVGSMGDDAPLAVLSDCYRGLHHFFRQNFSQVTNPPIDSLRERRVMTLITRFGNLNNILDETATQCQILQLPSPILTNGELAAVCRRLADTTIEIDCSFDLAQGTLREAIQRIQREAADAVREGRTHVVLSDRALGPDRAAIPMILATGAVHSHLMRQQLRTFTSLSVRSAECLDVHYAAVLVGVGATCLNPYLAEATIIDRQQRGLLPGLTAAKALAQYQKALNDGLLKIMAKMGIAVVSSYRGAYNFEAVGLSRALVAEFFPGMTSKISGIGLQGIELRTRETHARGFAEEQPALPIGGFYRWRRGGEKHAFGAEHIHLLQEAVGNDSYATFKRYTEALRKQPPLNLRDLLDFTDKQPPISVDEVESITALRKRLVAPGISLGALGPEAHETLSIAMNRIGAKSDSGEGGEDPARYKPKKNGDNASSAIKQVASGRFGVTAEYLNNCRELEIKVAQGAKPGEGGQLPGFKVDGLIAKLRHATPGVSLVSPPPHHDIYSIEDLAQLIYDLKQINPDAKVCVKLVARSGIGTIAAGVAKAKADVILISGHSGGTGASPQSSIKHAGIPWEMGLAEVHQVLVLNRLRHRVTLRTDGGIKTGRDVVIAAILGAEEFGLGTASLVAMGCLLVRQCHSNTCPVGICTQDATLRAKFDGTPEKVVNLFSFVAEEVREILASLGARTLTDVIGRTDLLAQVNRGWAQLDDLDLNPILAQADPGGYPRYCTLEGRNEVPDALDGRMIKDAAALFEAGEKMQLTYNIRNTDRALGTRLSSMITRKFGEKGLQADHITVRLRGSAGQSLGAFAVQGLKLEVFGDANDYVGKGLSGGDIVIRSMTASPLASHRNTIIGNTVLYGATAGRLFAAGQAGERFAVRNSGADAVIEGCGSNGCEYMTGGIAVILGPVGENFGAGMSGGMAFLYDPEQRFPARANPETIIWQRIESAHWDGVLRDLVRTHAVETQSWLAEQILADWGREASHFWQVVPKEMLGRLAHPLRLAAAE
jgi:glutamate synthase (NADPH) large chain